MNSAVSYKRGVMREKNIPDKIKKTADKFVAQLRRAYGEELVSVILYGSAASGDYSGRHSNINMAVILKDTSLGSLSKASRFINRRGFSAISPILLTEDYISSSTDVFPIEFLDMKENHVVLYGKDILGSIDVDMKNLRFQCEQELKSKIINIERAYLKTTNKFALSKLLFKSFTSGLHILRFCLRLKGKEPSYDKEKVIDDISREFGLDRAPLQRMLDARNRNLNLSRSEIVDLFTGLVEILEAVSDKIDLL